MNDAVAARDRLLPEQVIRPSRGTSLPDAIAELLHHRSVVAALIRRSVKVRYKQASLGALWALIQPLAFLGMFWFVFGRLAHIFVGNDLPYAAFLLTALVPWQFVSTAVPLALNSLVAESVVLRKVYVPREALILGALGSSLLDLGLGVGLLLVLAPLLGAHLGVPTLLVPLLLAVLALPVLGIGFATAALNAYYRDFRLAVPLAVQLWLFATPVVYSITSIGARWRGLYAALNPLVGPVEGFRQTVGHGALPDFGLLGISAATGTVMLLVGHRILKALEPSLADVV